MSNSICAIRYGQRAGRVSGRSGSTASLVSALGSFRSRPQPEITRTGSVTGFFSGCRDILASIDDEIAYAALGSGREGKAYIFEDQYLSTGGQLYELMIGHDRFLADLRALLRPILQQRGLQPGLCCHPYDLCTELIAREVGILVTEEAGLPL